MIGANYLHLYKSKCLFMQCFSKIMFWTK